MIPIDDVEALKRMAIAMLLGALVGLEREHADKPAGIRTCMLVSQGAALFMLAGLLISRELTLSGQFSDPGRVASTIVQGIGFLAAGVIITTGRKVRGLTTAAGIWVVAAIGLLTGAGFLLLAGVATVATVAALYLVKKYFEGGSARDEDQASPPPGFA
ncbi:MAG: MgtC/SapB family protein [Chloroflexota bacterium]